MEKRISAEKAVYSIVALAVALSSDSEPSDVTPGELYEPSNSSSNSSDDKELNDINEVTYVIPTHSNEPNKSNQARENNPARFSLAENRYICPCGSNFLTGELKELLTYIEKLNNKTYIQLVQERRDSVNMANQAVINLSDEADDEAHVDNELITILTNSFNINRQLRTAYDNESDLPS